MFSGSESRELLHVRVCTSCDEVRAENKGLEWASRVIGLIATAVIFYALATELLATGEPPLRDRGLGAHLLWVSPLVVSAFLALRFRTKAAKALGVTATSSPTPARDARNPPPSTLWFEFQLETSGLQAIILGLLGGLLVFMFSGSESRELLHVRVCTSCDEVRAENKGLEWASRVIGLIATAVIFYALATGEPPLRDRGLGAHLLWVSPLVVSAFLALRFRTKAAKALGVTAIGQDGDTVWLKAEDPGWTQAFIAANTHHPPPDP